MGLVVWFLLHCDPLFCVCVQVMESWSYVGEEKGYVSNEALSPPNTLGRTKGSFLGWELNTPCGFSNDMLALGQQNVEDQSFEELGFPGMLGKQLCGDPIGTVQNRKVDDDDVVDCRITSTSTSTFVAAPNGFSAREDFNSKLSNSLGDSNGGNSLIDLKLGRFADHGDAMVPTFSKGTPILSSSESSTPPKRVRASGLHSQAAHCQVYGCSKDLSGCKDYHKRHKVCEVHSKTSKVIVNGIEQRFCQQCSRLVNLKHSFFTSLADLALSNAYPSYLPFHTNWKANYDFVMSFKSFYLIFSSLYVVMPYHNTILSQFTSNLPFWEKGWFNQSCKIVQINDLSYIS